jgi:hypothetical protein
LKTKDPVIIDVIEIFQNDAEIDIEEQHPQNPLIQLHKITEQDEFNFLVLIVVSLVKLHIVFIVRFQF